MILRIDTQSPTPPYEQLREQLAALIATGWLAAGERLPPIRQLAGDLGVAGGTVARAYRELESAGLVRTRGRHGTTVAESGTSASHAAVLRAARRYASEARRLGLPMADAISAVQAAYALEGDQ